MVGISLVITKDGEDFRSLNVDMSVVPRVGEIIRIDAVASEPTLDENELAFREEYEGHWRCEVESVSWSVGHSLDKGEENNTFNGVVIDCRILD